MTASTSSTIILDCSRLSIREFVEQMASHGWLPEAQAMHLSPVGDEHDWVFCNDSKHLSNILNQLDSRKTYGGIVLWREGSDDSASFTINWEKDQIQILWGDGCPKDQEWPRVVDCSWAMSEIRTITKGLSARPSSVLMLFIAP